MKISKLSKVNKKLLSWLFAIGFTFLPISKGKTETAASQIIPDKKVESIFDEDNIESNQYGANQRVFHRKADALIKDENIIKIFAKYFPDEEFSSHDAAVNFYKCCLEVIYDHGCGDAVACDVTFHIFDELDENEREEDFKICFDYPMYTYDEQGNIDYNYEYFMADYFCYRITHMKDGKKLLRQNIEKDLYDYDLKVYTMSEEFTRKKPDNLTEKELEEWKAFEAKRDETFNYLYKRWQNATNANNYLGVKPDANFGYLCQFLAQHYVDINEITLAKDLNFQPGDVICCKNFDLYVDENGTRDPLLNNKIGDHYVYVTDVTPDGKIIVSTWGKKYYFDNSKAAWTYRIVFKGSVSDKINYFKR